jgi:hypothetical protein
MAEVTISNAQLIELFERYRADGFGYAGVERHAGGWLAGKQMAEVAAGDKTLAYPCWPRPSAGRATPRNVFLILSRLAVIGRSAERTRDPTRRRSGAKP